jgi:hypothetical protein
MLVDNITCLKLVSRNVNNGKLVHLRFKVLSGGILGNGSGRFSDKVIKF